MIERTDRHCRFFHRLLSKRVKLYTEMIVDRAVIYGDRARILDEDAPKDGVVLQLAGSEPETLAEATRIAIAYGYKEINLNCGCPSDRVGSGGFGAVLMLDRERSARLVGAMIKAAGASVRSAKISLKTRLGVDDQREEETLPAYISALADAGLKSLTLHARKAWLSGLSPKENREIPPLDYDLARAMKDRFKDMEIEINGGIESLDDALGFVEEGFASAMIGRAAYALPFDILAPLDGRLARKDARPCRSRILDAMIEYARKEMEKGTKLSAIAQPMIGLYHGEPGARAWRRKLSEGARTANASPEALFTPLAISPP